MYRSMQRLRSVRTSGASIFRNLELRRLRRKASNSWSAIQDTYLSTKDIFERHRVVFTVATSIGSVVTAWIGYSLHHYHNSRVDKRLESIEAAELKMDGKNPFEKLASNAFQILEQMKQNYEIGDPEFKKLVSHNVSLPACLATAGTTFVLGYGFGWRGGRWYQTRKYRKEQMKLLGQIKPRGWSPNISLSLRQLEFRRSLPKILRRPLVRIRLPGTSKTSEASGKNASVARNAWENNT